MRRIAVVATPGVRPDMRPSAGALDGDAVRTRLPQEDTAFEVVEIDPGEDFALQLEDLFDKEKLGEGDELLLYAATTVATSADGELFLCLDPANPESGDSLRDLALVIRDRFRGRTLFFLECRHAPDLTDPFRAVTLVGMAKEMIDPRGTGIGMLVAARPTSTEEDMPSALTLAFLAALDGADTSIGLTIEQFYDDAIEDLAGIVPGFAHARGRGGFPLLAGTKRTMRPPESHVSPSDAPSTFRSAVPAPPVAAVAPVAAFDVSEASDVGPASDRRVSQPPTALPQERSFQRIEPQLAKVIVSDRPPPPRSVPPPAPRVSTAPTPSVSSPPPGGVEGSADQHIADGDKLSRSNDPEGALAAFKRALVVLAPTDVAARAAVFVRIGVVKRDQNKRREAISQFEKAIGLVPKHPEALESLLDLNSREGDWRAVQSVEDRLLAMIDDAEPTFDRLVEFGTRWMRLGLDDARARALLEMAHALKPQDPRVLDALKRLYERGNNREDAIATRRKLAAVQSTPRARAEGYADLASYHLLELKREDEALELFELALDTDPSMLDPLTIVARVLADRQEWSELENAYRRMLERAPRIPEPSVRSEVTFELCRLLALLFRDHLEDPGLALDAFEDALEEKPDDASTRLTTANLARSLGQNERAIPHLQALAALDPARTETFHELFEVFQRTRRPDHAYSTACVSMHLKKADARERIIFDEHRPQGVPKLTRPLRPEARDLLRVEDRDRNVDAVLDAVAEVAIRARLTQLAEAGKLPTLDPAARQDPQRSTASIVRSFTWASHFLGVPAPAIYVHEDAPLAIATVIAEEPSVIAGSAALRGKSLPELAFQVGRHLSYHVAGHRLMLYYPSLEELSACFVAAVMIASPDVALPAAIEAAATDLKRRFEPRMTDAQRAELTTAVRAFEAEKKRANLAAWVAGVERFATRAGHLVCGDLDSAVAVLRADPRGIVDADGKIQDLYAFVVSDANHALRDEVGIAVQP